MFSEPLVVFSEPWLCFPANGCVFRSLVLFSEGLVVFSEDLVVFSSIWLCFLDVNVISKNLVVFLGLDVFLMQLVCRSSSVSESLCKPTDGIHHKCRGFPINFGNGGA